jgi:phosphoribosylaminoimidazole (AIR) synthetase
MKKSLELLTVSQLKSLADKHGLKIKSTVTGDGFWEKERRLAPTKAQYINKLKAIATEKEVNLLQKTRKRK